MGNPDTLSPEAKAIVKRVDTAVYNRIEHWEKQGDVLQWRRASRSQGCTRWFN